ncbi:MAG: SDR family oxidoreductase [Ancalomicrobiaceae bacterium]|nr:SDR family oxidoreductase [Ancalomicrobiaceae bacterium]
MHLLIFGLGYSARYSLEYLGPHIDSVAATTRSEDKAERMEEKGIVPILFDGMEKSDAIVEALGVATHILVSAAPDGDGDPVLRLHGPDIVQAASGGPLKWIGYFSTVGVYGDTGGEWVDETAPCRPSSERSGWRLAAEEGWRRVGTDAGVATAILRLAGIYGPGRNHFVNLQAGTARRVMKPDQVFNRIHVDDIAAVVERAAVTAADGIYNVTDDEPAASEAAIAYAAELMGVPVPDGIPFDQAELSPMAKSFYADNKRIRNARIKSELDVELAYPSYREGLKALWQDEVWRGDAEDRDEASPKFKRG